MCFRDPEVLYLSRVLLPQLLCLCLHVLMPEDFADLCEAGEFNVTRSDERQLEPAAGQRRACVNARRQF